MATELGRKLSFSSYLVEKVGFDNVKPSSKIGRMLYSQGVPRAGEFRRIEQLPRRVWETDATLAEAAAQLTLELREEWGEKPCAVLCRNAKCEKAGTTHCHCPVWLKPVQAITLIEAATWNGAFCPIGVGGGKALISIMAATLLKAERPVLFVPASLRDQTNMRVLPQLRRHGWRVHPGLRVLGYSELSIAKNKHMLDRLRPDLLVLDEAHAVKNKSARTTRVKEYLAENPETRVVALSGTMTRRSILDYWRTLAWTLKPDRMPLPTSWREAQLWSRALDPHIDEHERVDPGALWSLCETDDEEARAGYRRRLVQTPGVIAFSADDCDASIELAPFVCPIPPDVKRMLDQMRATWETPDGGSMSEAVELWRHCRELALGFWYKWDPSPPTEWLQARREWKRYVRETLKHNRRGLDSELLVAGECSRMAEPPKEYVEWHDIRDTFEPNTVAEWVSDHAVNAFAAWLHESRDLAGGGGIVWTEHVAFGERLASVAGVPYLGAGEDAARAILDVRGPVVLSIRAHGTGQNLQDRYSRMLMSSPSSSGQTWQQAIGRVHRDGQTADHIELSAFSAIEEHINSINSALADARYVEETTGERQKLLYADRTIPGLAP